MFDSQAARRSRTRRAGGPTLHREQPASQLVLLTTPEPPLGTLDDKYGEVFTRRWVVELILDLVGYTANRDLASLRAVEPACGAGAFLVPMVERLGASLRSRKRPLSDASNAIRAYDLLERNVGAARDAVTATLLAQGWATSDCDAVTSEWIVRSDFLLRQDVGELADVVVGNPPYIRLEDIPAQRSAAYRAACQTMGGRADVFVGFYERGLRALKPEGRLGFICADRWMRNAYGARLRQLVADHYAVDAVLVMHDVDAFDAAVSAYPAITILRAGAQGRAAVAETNAEFTAATAARLTKWIGAGDPIPLHAGGLVAAWLPQWFDTSGSWPTGSPERTALIAELERRFPPLEDESTGTRIGIGLASGADDVYVTKKGTLVEPERLLPMVVGRDLRTGTLDWSGTYLVNPWDDRGLIDLKEFPALKAYYERHRPILRRRSTAQASPARWYKTIDRMIPGLRETPKLLFRDLGAHIWPVLDEGLYYPHHNLYWLTSRDWDLRVLGGLLLSDLAELFVRTYCVRMRGGTLRFQAQYLRKIRVPRFSDISQRDREILADAFDRRDTAAATRVALKLYGVKAIPD